MNRIALPMSPIPRLMRRSVLRTVLSALAFLVALSVLAARPASAQTADVAPARPAATPGRPTATPEREVQQATRSEQLVFSMGVVTAVDGQTVTVGFVDGDLETYRITPTTTIQSQHGDAQTVADLDVGADVIVLSHEGNPTALTIVNGGDAGFAEAGPADIRGHEQDDACAPCEDATEP